jgi:hypothetical protein
VISNQEQAIGNRQKAGGRRNSQFGVGRKQRVGKYKCLYLKHTTYNLQPLPAVALSVQIGRRQEGTAITITYNLKHKAHIAVRFSSGKACLAATETQKTTVKFAFT